MSQADRCPRRDVRSSTAHPVPLMQVGDSVPCCCMCSCRSRCAFTHGVHLGHLGEKAYQRPQRRAICVDMRSDRLYARPYVNAKLPA